MTEAIRATNRHDSKPSLWKWLTVGILLMLVGIAIAFAGGAVSVLGILGSMHGGVQFQGPGEVKLPVAEPGIATVYQETAGFYDGRGFGGRPTPPAGALITVLDPNGVEVPSNTSLSMTMQSGATRRQSLVTFDATIAGDYTVVVAGGPEDEVYYATDSGIGDLITNSAWMMLAMVVGAVAVIAGLAVLIVGVVRWATHRPATG